MIKYVAFVLCLVFTDCNRDVSGINPGPGLPPVYTSGDPETNPNPPITPSNPTSDPRPPYCFHVHSLCVLSIAACCEGLHCELSGLGLSGFCELNPVAPTNDDGDSTSGNDGGISDGGSDGGTTPPSCGVQGQSCCSTGDACVSGLVCGDDNTCAVNGPNCPSFPYSACSLTHGYYKNHSCWPLSYLKLGTRQYDLAELNSILNQMPNGNGLVSLSQQLITAKLNIAEGASTVGLGSAVADADVNIGSLVVPPVGSGWLDPIPLQSLNVLLNSFNSGELVSPYCN